MVKIGMGLVLLAVVIGLAFFFITRAKKAGGPVMDIPPASELPTTPTKTCGSCMASQNQ